MDISIIITTYKEPRTIGKAIESILHQKIVNKSIEIIVVAPDEETLSVARKYPKVRTIKDNAQGKSAALNLVVPKAKGKILILTDGDVYTSPNAIAELIKPFNNKKIGAVSGNVVSINSTNNKFGYWAYILTNIANDIRLEKLNNSSKFFCTGYLFAIRKELFPVLPINLLSEDGYISNHIYDSHKTIAYAQAAAVYVKYPDNFKVLIIQKKRSAGGYTQIKKLTGTGVRSFVLECIGVFKLFKYIHNSKELYWFGLLIFARLYLWFLIYRDVNVKNVSQKEIWKRVESTK